MNHYFKGILITGMLIFLVLPGLKSQTPGNEQVVRKAVNSGSFTGQPGALKALTCLIGSNNPTANDPDVIDCLIQSGASMLDDQADWTNPRQAREIYNTIKRFGNGHVTESLVRIVLANKANRLKVLILGVKLGIQGSETRLNQVLVDYGDVRMAEDFLNSGSEKLYEGGKQWGHKNGYEIQTGEGSHRTNWGSF